MAEQNYTIDQDLKEAEAMVKGLESYLQGDDLYGKVGGGGLFGGGNMPSLTVGALVMRLRRLHLFREQMSHAQRARLDAITTQHDSIRKEWRVHYEAKLLREANSRLDAMRGFFQEIQDSPSMAAGIYKPEIQRRTIVQEILTEMESLGIQSADLDGKVRQIDSRLRSAAPEQTAFLWADALQSAYPQREYWWLYTKPREHA
jgi:hypothetical protein